MQIHINKCGMPADATAYWDTREVHRHLAAMFRLEPGQQIAAVNLTKEAIEIVLVKDTQEPNQ